MKSNVFDRDLRIAIVGLAVLLGNGAVSMAQKSCECGEPSQGRVTCENKQEPFCVVKNGKIDARCRSSRGKYGAALQREILEEALGRPLTDAEWRSAELQASLAKGEVSLKDTEGKALLVMLRPTSDFEKLPQLEPFKFAPSGSYPLDQLALIRPRYSFQSDSFYGGAGLNFNLGLTYRYSNVVSDPTAGWVYYEGGKVLSYMPTRSYSDYGFSQFNRSSPDFYGPSPLDPFYVRADRNSAHRLSFNGQSGSDFYEGFQLTGYAFAPLRLTAGNRSARIVSDYGSPRWQFAFLLRPVETARHSRPWWWKDSLLGLPCTMCVERTLEGQVCEDFSARTKAEVKAQSEKMCQGDFLCASKQPTITCK